MKDRRKGQHLFRCGVCIWLCWQLIIPAALAQNVPALINIVVVEGEGAVNNVRQRVARDPVVRIEDENHRPVAGAAVAFTLPISGASGEFAKAGKTATVMTDQQGLAAAPSLKTNQVAGKLQIYVTASYRGLRARALINQVNVEPAGGSHGGGGKVWIIVALVGAAAAGGAIAATQAGKSSSSGSTPAPPAAIGITAGTGTITHP